MRRRPSSTGLRPSRGAATPNGAAVIGRRGFWPAVRDSWKTQSSLAFMLLLDEAVPSGANSRESFCVLPEITG